MANNPHPQRRDFLKTAAAGAAGAMGISALKFDKLFAQSTGNVWTSGMQINPAIDNKRVVCCHDPTMLAHYPAAGSAVKTDFASQNSYADPAKIATNMDQMAMQLAQKTSATDAWSTIFRTGNSGSWGSTRVAIKVNGINGDNLNINRSRVAVIKKICDVLVDQFGVKPANIVLYDACDYGSRCFGAYVDANDSTGAKIRAAPVSDRAAGLGGFKAVTLTTTTGVSCPADLVDGKIDILVNIAVAKMHNGPGGGYGYGTVTLCMKNHLGTFTDGQTPQKSGALHSMKAIIEINQHSAVLGGNPVRQQLCIVDALLSNGASGPGGSADNRTDRLVMGTFAPFVDYFTGNYILFDPTIMATKPIPQPGLTAAATLIPQFATGFGYTAPSASPATPDPGWISYEAGSPINPSGTGGTGGGSGGASGSGGTSAAGGARSGGTSPAGGARTGGTSASGGASGSGGTSASGGASGSGGTSGSGGASGSGGTSGSGGARTGGASASGGSASGGTSASGGSASGGTTSGSGGAGGTGGASASASGGSATTGGSTSGNRTGGSSGTPGSTAKSGNSEGGCEVAGVDRRATRWGAMLAFGAVVAEKLRRLVSSDNDRSS